jgi:Tfp pilus assembly protein PilX
MVRPNTTPKAGKGQEGAYLLMVIGAILLLPIIAVIRSVLSERRRNNNSERADLHQQQPARATTSPEAENQLSHSPHNNISSNCSSCHSHHDNE